MSYSRRTSDSFSRAPVVNPYEQFTQPEFDDFVSGLTSKIRDALHPRRGVRGVDGDSEASFAHRSYREFSFGRSVSVADTVQSANAKSVPRSSEEIQDEDEEQSEDY